MERATVKSAFQVCPDSPQSRSMPFSTNPRPLISAYSGFRAWGLGLKTLRFWVGEARKCIISGGSRTTGCWSFRAHVPFAEIVWGLEPSTPGRLHTRGMPPVLPDLSDEWRLRASVARFRSHPVSVRAEGSAAPEAA